MSETSIDTEVAAPRPPSAPDRERWPLTSLVRWESALVVVLILTIIWSSHESANFANSTTVFYIGLNMGEIAIMALPLMLIVMTGEIDLSVASMLGLSGALLGYLFEHGWPIYVAMLAVHGRRGASAGRSTAS